MKLFAIATLLLLFALIETKQGGKGVRRRTIHRLNDARMRSGAKIGFLCKRVQVPLFRSHQKRPTIVFESITIIKYTRIVISGEIAFDLVCRRDTKTDKGIVVPPKEAEEAAKDTVDKPDEEVEEASGDSGEGEVSSQGEVSNEESGEEGEVSSEESGGGGGGFSQVKTDDEADKGENEEKNGPAGKSKNRPYNKPKLTNVYL